MRVQMLYQPFHAWQKSYMRPFLVLELSARRDVIVNVEVNVRKGSEKMFGRGAFS